MITKTWAAIVFSIKRQPCTPHSPLHSTKLIHSNLKDAETYLHQMPYTDWMYHYFFMVIRCIDLLHSTSAWSRLASWKNISQLHTILSKEYKLCQEANMAEVEGVHYLISQSHKHSIEQYVLSMCVHHELHWGKWWCKLSHRDCTPV